jgi:adenylate cyclase
VVAVLFTGLLTLAVLRSRIHLLAEVKSEVVRLDLARYISPDVAEALTDHESWTFGDPSTRHVAVLFADIVGFTGLAERLSPYDVFALLQDFQLRSSRVVLNHKGTLDKYLGDGLMATFGALQHENDAAERAIACAFALRDEIELWSVERRMRAATSIRIAIGAHCGSTMVGNLGSERQRCSDKAGCAPSVLCAVNAALPH